MPSKNKSGSKLVKFQNGIGTYADGTMYDKFGWHANFLGWLSKQPKATKDFFVWLSKQPKKTKDYFIKLGK